MTRRHTIDVPVAGGSLRVGIWEPVGDDHDSAPTLVAVHGVTSSHLAWSHVARALPDVRIVAPDLRGRGASVDGPAGMRAHATDLIAVLDALGVSTTTVAGHSMGAFVALVLADLAPERVDRLVLIDGGLPLDVPQGLDPDTLIAAILGPTAERLSRRWTGVEDYIADFWRDHPAFADDWSPELEEYIAYDLVPDGDLFRASTSYATTVDDTVDLNQGSALPDALEHLRHPTTFITVPRGLQNEEPGLYSPEHVSRLLAAHPEVRHIGLDDVNHYTVVMSERGAAALAPHLRAALTHPTSDTATRGSTT